VWKCKDEKLQACSQVLMPDSSHHSRNEICIGWDQHLESTSAAVPERISVRCLLRYRTSMI